MEAYITSIHIKQLKCAVQHYWFQVYSCLFWLASTMIVHHWKDIINNTTTLHHPKTSIHYYGGGDEDDYCCLSDHEEEEEGDEEDDDEEYTSDDETIVTTSVAPWSKERKGNEDTSTLHSFDTSISSSQQSESKSFMIKKKKMMALNHLKSQMTAWKQKHFQKTEIRRSSTQSSPPSSNHGLIKLFSKKYSIDQRPRISLATFRRKTSPDIY